MGCTHLPRGRGFQHTPAYGLCTPAEGKGVFSIHMNSTFCHKNMWMMHTKCMTHQCNTCCANGPLLNLGACTVVAGTSRAKLREMYNELGDMGDVAQACRHTQASPCMLSIMLHNVVLSLCL